MAQILLVQLPYQDYSTPDFSLVALEQEIFSLFSNLVLSIGHLPYFLVNDIDEVSWRLKFFDIIFEKEIPDLATHFKAINMQSQLYLYDWMLQLFVSVLPLDIVWRLWDIFFMKGEVFIYQAALGYLKYKKHWLLGNPMSHCLKVFKKTR